MVELLGGVIKYFASDLLFDLADDFESFAVLLAGLVAIGVFDELDIGLNGSVQDFRFYEAILMLVFGLERAVAPVASVHLVIFLDGLLIQLVVFDACHLFLPDFLVEIQPASIFRRMQPISNLGQEPRSDPKRPGDQFEEGAYHHDYKLVGQ